MKKRSLVFAAAAAAGVGLSSLAVREILRKREQIDLRGRVVLITGGSRGLGLQMAREFGAEGAIVAVCARDRDELDRAVQDLESRGVKAHAFVCDVTDRIQVSSLIHRVMEQIGAIDVLVNNAGVIKVGPLADMTFDDFEEAMAVIFWGTLNASLAVLPFMRERRQGSIVNITSIGGKVSVPHLLPYSCAKFAATALSEGLRTELKEYGIRVTTIVPGLMRTGSHLNAEFKGQHSKEYGWFAAGAATPLVSIDVERAARSIVQATVRGDAEKVLSVPADLAVRLHDAFPELTALVLEAVNRFLPSPAGSSRAMRGAEVEPDFGRFWKAMTRTGQKAAEGLNEV